jgi:hypothetical protein
VTRRRPRRLQSNWWCREVWEREDGSVVRESLENKAKAGERRKDERGGSRDLWWESKKQHGVVSDQVHQPSTDATMCRSPRRTFRQLHRMRVGYGKGDDDDGGNIEKRCSMGCPFTLTRESDSGGKMQLKRVDTWLDGRVVVATIPYNKKDSPDSAWPPASVQVSLGVSVAERRAWRLRAWANA